MPCANGDGSIAQTILIAQRIEQPLHLVGNVLGIAEHTFTFRDAYLPVLARPDVNIAEQVAVDSAIVPLVELTAGQPLACTEREVEGLQFVEFDLLAQARAILKNGRARIAVPLIFCFVHGASARLVSTDGRPPRASCCRPWQLLRI